jgi:DNA polymerase IV
VAPPTAATLKRHLDDTDVETVNSVTKRRHLNAGDQATHTEVDDKIADAIERGIRKASARRSFEVDTDTSEDLSTDDEAGIQPAAVTRGGFLCIESHDGKSKDQSPNAHTIRQLQQMADIYDTQREQFRVKAYREAIGKLRRHNHLVRTAEEARKIGLGEKIAAHVQEIVSTGRYRQLESAHNDPGAKLIELFTGVYGAGPIVARHWINQGYQSLDDLREKADLTANQKIGLDHYDDFQQTIPRSEVAQHGAVVEEALKAADPRLQLIIGGSYRRGHKGSGDIDCLIFMEGADIAHIRTLMLDTVVPGLMEQGFLKVALAAGHSSCDDSSKWHGASALAGSEVWRRIDLLFVPGDELGAALLYFTGNDLYNRSLRLLASTKGMRLNQHGLYEGVMRGPGRKRINDGTLVESRDEKRILEILGVPYLPPEGRDHGV